MAGQSSYLLTITYTCELVKHIALRMILLTKLKKNLCDWQNIIFGLPNSK